MVYIIKNIVGELYSKLKCVYHIFVYGIPYMYSNYNKTMYSESDITELIRVINIESALGNIDIEPRLDRLDKKTIKYCREVTDKGMSIGGSVLLKASGLLDRPHGDVDIFGDVQKSILDGTIHRDNIINTSIAYEDSMVRYKIRDKQQGELDIFQISEDEVGTTRIVDGVRFNEPINTLRIKLGYFREKDVIDYNYIRDKLNI